MSKDTIGKTLGVAAILCVVCSVIVSYSAVSLKDKQQLNVELDIKKNILVASGLYDPNSSIEEQFKKFKPVLVNLNTGLVETDIAPENYNQKKAASDPDRNETIPAENDLAKIKKRADIAKIYHVMDGEQVDQIILPVHGKGLWSTMYGFMALDKDTTTVKGFAFYSHGETPGLGGEVDNPKWKAQWPGKKIYNDANEVAIMVMKGKASTKPAEAQYEVDGLSGATITTTGVRNLLKYWFGNHGFGKYLENFRANQGSM
jgi:Na+-transporting NADH:ubiquinone oxidoreductase subunit C